MMNKYLKLVLVILILLPITLFIPNQQSISAGQIIGMTELVSISSNGEKGNSSSLFPTISFTGRYVVFESDASNLVSGDTNERTDIFVHDRKNGTTERVSVSSTGEQGNNDSASAPLSMTGPSISATGRFVAFEPDAPDLNNRDSNERTDVFVHDRKSGRTERVSVSSTGEQGNYNSGSPSISAFGRFVTFHSGATNLVSGNINGLGRDIFIHDRNTEITELVSVSSNGEQGIYPSKTGSSESISYDGRFITFMSHAINLVSGDNNGVSDIFVHDRKTSVTERVSVSSSGEEGDYYCDNSSISEDGRYVAFSSIASNLVSGDTNGRGDIFVYDRETGEIERVSVSTSGVQGNGLNTYSSISADGRFVAFYSFASNLVSNDANRRPDVFIRDRQSGVTELVSISSWGESGNKSSGSPSISANGRYVAFHSFATNLDSRDTDRSGDIYVRDRNPLWKRTINQVYLPLIRR